MSIKQPKAKAAKSQGGRGTAAKGWYTVSRKKKGRGGDHGKRVKLDHRKIGETRKAEPKNKRWGRSPVKGGGGKSYAPPEPQLRGSLKGTVCPLRCKKRKKAIRRKKGGVQGEDHLLRLRMHQPGFEEETLNGSSHVRRVATGANKKKNKNKKEAVEGGGLAVQVGR